MDATLGKSTHSEKATSSNKLVQSYYDFCDSQNQYRIAWFLFPALILPCLFMPAATYFMMTYKGVGFLAFLFVSMMLFIGGMVANVGGQTTRVTIGIFLFAVVWNILYPAISILLF